MVPTAARHDVVIIGGGPGGYAAALYGAAAGLDVGLVEQSKVGGTCLHVGCIPAKELLETAAVHRAVASAKEFGIDAGEPSVDFGVTQERKQKVIDQLFRGLTGLLKHRSVTRYEGTGSLAPDRLVTVIGPDGAETQVTGDAVLLASGSLPRTIPGFEVDGEVVVTSDELLSLSDLPRRAAVIGGGAIGCEFASMMADLGTTVTVLEALPKIIPGADDECTRVVQRAFKKRGIDIRTGVQVTGHVPGAGATTVQFGDGESLEVDLVVMSVGRRPRTEGLGLDGTGVEVDERGFIVVDEWCRTAVEGVYAAGDVIDTPALAHVGYAEGILVMRQLLAEAVTPIDYEKVPWCIYCHPEVAFAGLSEQAAREAGHEVVTAKHRFGGNGRALILGEPDGLVKVVAERREDGSAGRLLGVHMVGPWVTEQLSAGYLAVNWEAEVEDIAALIQPHPTLGETFGDTMLAFIGRGLHG